MLALERDGGKLPCMPETGRSHGLDGQVRNYRVKYSYRSLTTRKPAFLGGMLLGVFWQIQPSDGQGRLPGEELSGFEL